MQEIKAAVHITKETKPPTDTQQRNWKYLSWATIIVSFAHMVGALTLFSDGSGWGRFIAAMMTGLVDGATWVCATYLDFAKRREMKRNNAVVALLVGALTISFGLNLAYMLTNRPATLNGTVATAIAVVFSIFIPACIGVASLTVGELEDSKSVNVDKQNDQLSTKQHRTTANVITPQPKALPAVNVDTVLEIPSSIDKRAVDWHEQNEAGATYAAISAGLGGSPSRQYIGDQVKRYRAWLTALDTAS